MTPDEQIKAMTAAMKQAIKVMGDRFGSTERDVLTAIEGLKTSMQGGDGKTAPLSKDRTDAPVNAAAVQA